MYNLADPSGGSRDRFLGNSSTTWASPQAHWSTSGATNIDSAVIFISSVEKGICTSISGSRAFKRILPHLRE